MERFILMQIPQTQEKSLVLGWACRVTHSKDDTRVMLNKTKYVLFKYFASEKATNVRAWKSLQWRYRPGKKAVFQEAMTYFR